MGKSYIFAICGGSGSGKTTFAGRLQERLGPENCSIIAQDSYYYDQSHRFDCDGGSVNFDHPSAVDFDLMYRHLEELKSGRSIHLPLYDFKTHSRLEQSEKLKPSPIILLDGILLFSQEQLRELFNESVFVDVDEQTRFQRRLKRDVEQRGRTAEGVRKQFKSQVKPMHDLYVEPFKELATHLIQSLECFDRILSEVSSDLKQKF